MIEKLDGKEGGDPRVHARADFPWGCTPHA